MRANIPIRDAYHKIELEWLARVADFISYGNRSQIEQMISQYRGGQSCKLVQQIEGDFNYCLWACFDDDNKEWVLRFPKPGCTMQPNEKVKSECAVMRFIAQHTTIPIPKVIAYGVAEGELSWLGPYIIMEAVEGERLDTLILDKADKIKSEVSEITLEKIYRQVADILLQLNSCTFDKIGSLNVKEYEDKELWTVCDRPMTMKSNEIARMGGIRDDLRGPVESTSRYLSTLVDQSLYYLEENPMSSDTAYEASSDYSSIQTLKAAITTVDTTDTDSECYLFNDDLRFGNILVDKNFNIVALIDWEFCYSGPAIFHQSPPSWIIGRDPFEWDNEDAKNFSKHLSVLVSMIKEEETHRGCGTTLSTRMQRSWDDGTFWLTVALREYRFLEEIMIQARKVHCFEEVQTDPKSSNLEEESGEFAKHKMEQRSRYEVEALTRSDNRQNEDHMQDLSASLAQCSILPCTRLGYN